MDQTCEIMNALLSPPPPQSNTELFVAKFSDSDPHLILFAEMRQAAKGGHAHTLPCFPHPELDEVNIMAAFSQKGVGTLTFVSPVSPNIRMSKVPKPNLNKHM